MIPRLWLLLLLLMWSRTSITLEGYELLNISHAFESSSFQSSRSLTENAAQRNGCFAVEMVGRMGNLMFEYASMVGLCTARGLPYRSCAHIPQWMFRWSDAEFPLEEFVRTFGIKAADTEHCQMTGGTFVEHSQDVHAVKFDRLVRDLSLGMTIKGFLQSWKYFHPHAQNEVREVFTLPEAPARQGEAYIDNIRRSLPSTGFTLVAVHVRLGDKLNNKFYNEWSLSTAYYAKAIALLQGRHDKVAFVFFTGGAIAANQMREDVHWTQSHLGAEIQHKFFEHSSSHLISLQAMMLCDAIVVAHSSFSWWAAYLSRSNEIVAPRLLFPPGGPECKVNDYYLPWWSLLDANSSLDRIVGFNPLI